MFARALSRVVLSMVVALMMTAWTPAHAADVVLSTKIKFVYPWGNGGVVIGVLTESAACTSTAAPSKYYWVLAGQYGMTADGAKNLMAAALAAMAMEKTVVIVFDDSTSSCFINRMIVNG